MLKPLLAWMSPAGARACLSVLIFHRVLPAPDALFPDEVDAGRFDAICGWLKHWFNVLPLDEAVARLKAGTLPSRAACITFDDGYADNQEVALPVLLRHGLNATFFIATGFLDGGRMWNDTVIESVRSTALPLLHLDSLLDAESSSLPVATTEEKRAAIQRIIGAIKYRQPDERIRITERIAEAAQVQLPTGLMMRSSQVKALRLAGMTIGAHTVTHPILANLDRVAAVAEIAESRDVLEQLLGERIGLFAYPNGKPEVDYDADNVAVVRELGFDGAVSTRWAASRTGTDHLQIPRFTPWDKGKTRFGCRLAQNLLKY